MIQLFVRYISSLGGLFDVKVSVSKCLRRADRGCRKK